MCHSPKWKTMALSVQISSRNKVMNRNRVQLLIYVLCHGKNKSPSIRSKFMSINVHKFNANSESTRLESSPQVSTYFFQVLTYQDEKISRKTTHKKT